MIEDRDTNELIDTQVRIHVICEDLGAAYCQMAQEEEREREALEWAEATVEIVTDGTQ